jgi:hypothetical protein
MIFVYARLGGSAMLRDSNTVRPYARSDAGPTHEIRRLNLDELTG